MLEALLDRLFSWKATATITVARLLTPPPMLPRPPPPPPPPPGLLAWAPTLALWLAAQALLAVAIHVLAKLVHARLAKRKPSRDAPSWSPSASSSSQRSPSPRHSAPPHIRRSQSLVVEKDHKYVQGIKIWNVGILEDPVPGEKRGRGIQHLTSSYWLYDMGVFINREFYKMQVVCALHSAGTALHTTPRVCSRVQPPSSPQAMCRWALEHSTERPGFDFRYFTNVGNALFVQAEAQGLLTKDARDFFLMAAWCTMAAAEVDGFRYAKYSPARRAAQREAFYHKYLHVDVVWDHEEEDDPEIESALGKYAIEGCRIDLIPSVALERLGIHNELCSLKWKDPTQWMKEVCGRARRARSSLTARTASACSAAVSRRGDTGGGRLPFFWAGLSCLPPHRLNEAALRVDPRARRHGGPHCAPAVGLHGHLSRRGGFPTPQRPGRP